MLLLMLHSQHNVTSGASWKIRAISHRKDCSALRRDLARSGENRATSFDNTLNKFESDVIILDKIFDGDAEGAVGVLDCFEGVAGGFGAVCEGDDGAGAQDGSGNVVVFIGDFGSDAGDDVTAETTG